MIKKVIKVGSTVFLFNNSGKFEKKCLNNYKEKFLECVKHFQNYFIEQPLFLAFLGFVTPIAISQENEY